MRSSARSSAVRLVAIDRGDVGVRLDRVLLRHLGHEPGVSRARIQRWIESGRVLVNGRSAPRVAWRIAAGDEVTLDGREVRARRRPRAEDLSIEVLYEDAHLIAVNKPAGMVVHPSFRHASGTLMNALLWRAREWPEGDTPALLTRLDRMTSGVVLVAKRRAVIVALQREMRAERIHKDYLAVVLGRPSPARGTLDMALDRDPWDRRRVTVTDRGGQRAVTLYERLATARWPASEPEPAPDGPTRAREVSLVRCRLVTGRMHQIRVHLAYKGWPILGDPKYGSRNALGPSLPPGETPLQAGRQALHAWRVALTHPVTGEPLTIEAPVPDDMRRFMAAVRLAGPGAAL
jgi:23S rRNA pseudouridine1911/1915/1917 synthase